MTREELEKEAKDNKPPYACCTFDTYCGIWEDGFKKGAEPREKQIAELEQENAGLKEHLKCLIEGMYHIAQHHPTMGAHTKIMQDLREAEQFISEVEK